MEVFIVSHRPGRQHQRHKAAEEDPLPQQLFEIVPDQQQVERGKHGIDAHVGLERQAQQIKHGAEPEIPPLSEPSHAEGIVDHRGGAEDVGRLRHDELIQPDDIRREQGQRRRDAAPLRREQTDAAVDKPGCQRTHGHPQELEDQQIQPPLAEDKRHQPQQQGHAGHDLGAEGPVHGDLPGIGEYDTADDVAPVVAVQVIVHSQGAHRDQALDQQQRHDDQDGAMRPATAFAAFNEFVNHLSVSFPLFHEGSFQWRSPV